MRIGFFSGSAKEIGSGQGLVYPLAHACSRQGHEPVIAEVAWFAAQKWEVSGIPVHCEPMLPFLVRHPSAALQLGRAKARAVLGNATQAFSPPTPYDSAVAAALATTIKKLQLDAFYAFHNVNAWSVLHSCPTPSAVLVVNLIGFGIDRSRGGSSDTFPYQALLFQRPEWDLHVTATEFEFSRYLDVYQRLGLPQRKLVVLPHSYDVDLFRPLDQLERLRLRDRYHLSRTTLALVCPVNVYRRKNIELAVDVLAILNRYSNTVLFITGRIWDQDYHRALVRRSAQLAVEDKIVFLKGQLSHAQMAAIYNTADVTIITSHQETFGLGIIESLGCGTPVVGPDWIIPCREILGRSPGAWTAPKQAEPFAQRVIEAVEARSSVDDLADAARTAYGNHAVATRLLAWIEPLRAEKAARAAAAREIDWKALYSDGGCLL